MRIVNNVAPNCSDFSDDVQQNREYPSSKFTLNPVNAAKVSTRCSCHEGLFYSLRVKQVVVVTIAIFLTNLCLYEYNALKSQVQEISIKRDEFRAKVLSLESTLQAEVIKRGVLETQTQEISLENNELRNETVSMKRMLESEFDKTSRLANQLQEASIGSNGLRAEVLSLKKLVEDLSIKKADLAAEVQVVSMERNELEVKLLFLNAAVKSKSTEKSILATQLHKISMERDELKAELSLIKETVKSESSKTAVCDESRQSSKRDANRFESEYYRFAVAKAADGFDISAIIQGVMSVLNTKLNSFAFGFADDALTWLFAV